RPHESRFIGGGTPSVTGGSQASFIRVLTLAHHVNDEAGQREHAAPAPWLPAQAMQPFQAVIAHPPRGAPSSTGDEVEASTHTHADDRARAGEVAGEPGFFRGRAIAKEEQLGTTPPNRRRGERVAGRIG